jgi:hypothetical protein
VTHFLEVGFIREGIQEVQENGRWLRRLLAMTRTERAALEQSRVQQGDLTTHADDVRMALNSLLTCADELITCLDRFESNPIIYTGVGSTAEVLAMLERLMHQVGVDGQKP